MTFSRPLTLTIVLATLATGGVALAQSQERPIRGAAMSQEQAMERAERAFARLDANDDGVLDPGDRAEHRRAQFARLDADGDGAISLAEFEAAGEARGVRERRLGRMMQNRIGRMAAGADTDLDGTVSEAEFRAAAMARFAAADTDGDGLLIAEERRAQRGERRWQRRGPSS